MPKNANNFQMLVILLVVWLIGLTINTLLVHLGWSLLSWGEVVTMEPTWPGSWALGTVLFVLRTMFASTAKKK